MNLVGFLQDISLKGVKLWCDGEKLRTGGSQGVLTPDMIAQLKQYKTQILQLLQYQLMQPLIYGLVLSCYLVISILHQVDDINKNNVKRYV